jgi:hypothetical protein
MRIAMGKTKHQEQAAMWVAVSELAWSVRRPHYEKLNRCWPNRGSTTSSRRRAGDKAKHAVDLESSAVVAIALH